MGTLPGQQLQMISVLAFVTLFQPGLLAMIVKGVANEILKSAWLIWGIWLEHKHLLRKNGSTPAGYLQVLRLKQASSIHAKN
jgi:hypothetical protein